MPAKQGPRVTLSTSSTYPASLVRSFEIAAALGYDGVELMVGIDPMSTDIDQVADLAQHHQIPVLSVHAPCLAITQTVWGGDPWTKLRRSCQAARRLGAEVVVVHPPFRWQRDYARGFVPGVRELAQETGITIAVENMYPWRGPGIWVQGYLPSWDPTDQDYDALTLDLSHASTSGQQAMDLVAAWGPRLRHLHLTDGRGGVLDEHLFPGEGDQRAWEVVETLAGQGFDGIMVHEVDTRRVRDELARESLLLGLLRHHRSVITRGLVARKQL